MGILYDATQKPETEPLSVVSCPANIPDSVREEADGSAGGEDDA